MAHQLGSARARLGTALLAAALALACGERGGAAAPAAPAQSAPGFDGARAFRDLEAQVRLGPRPAGSPAAEATRALIRERLRQAGWVVETHRARVQPPGVAPLEIVNLIARRAPAERDCLLVIAHYDTKPIPGVEFVGANDGASGTAVLLELARVLATRELPLPVVLVFSDGEEAVGPTITERDGLYGSRALAERMAQDGSLARVRAAIVVDMVGDADLNLAVDLGSTPALRAILAREAAALGETALVDAGSTMMVTDDHSPFQQRGVANVLAVIDFQYGARSSPGPLWHTGRDDLSAVSSASLERVGRVLVEALAAIGEHVRAPGGSSP